MSTDTVVVACKLPNGLVCSVVDMKDFETQHAARAKAPGVPGPIRVVIKGKFRLRGYQEARLLDTQGVVESDARNVVGRFGLTRNVPKDLWDEWLAQNREYPPVVNGLIYAHAQDRSAIDYAKEHAKLATGFDARDPRNPAPGVAPEAFDGMDSQDKAAAARGMPTLTG